MNGRTYYTFAAPRQSVRFFALESDYLTGEQIAWLEAELARATEAWRIVFMHHPLYSSGRTHGPSLALRRVLEPVFVRNGVDVVFAGHEHFYERLHPQRGVAYVISGAAGQLRRGDLHRPSAQTAAGFDADRHFVLVEIDGDRLYFEALSRTGETVDSGVIARRERSRDEARSRRAPPRVRAPAPARRRDPLRRNRGTREPAPRGRAGVRVRLSPRSPRPAPGEPPPPRDTGRSGS
jgi:hypothetical protein